MVVIELNSAALKIKANCHFNCRPWRNTAQIGKRENGLFARCEVPLQHVTLLIPIRSALAYFKQLIWIGLLPSKSLCLLTNKHDDNIVSQAVVCKWAARWRQISDSCLTKQCVVTWPAAEGVCEDAEDGEGDIKPRQMGWNNSTMQVVCDRLHQLIKGTAMYWWKEEI